MGPSSIAVVYLARFAEGAEPVRDFVASWRRHPTGIDCDLIVVWKGFPDCDPVGTEQHGLLSPIAHRSIRMSDEGLDLTAYKIAAETLDHEYICCLNTFSRIERSGWLRMLFDAATAPGNGMAGATASLESIKTSMRLMTRDVFYATRGARYNRRIALAWRAEIEQFAPAWLDRSVRARVRHLIRIFVLNKHYPSRSWLDERFDEFWKENFSAYEGYPGFPNPHLRSNAFLVDRQLYVGLAPARLESKESCYEFESGYSSLTRQLRQLGLNSVVVGADGVGYEERNWKRSNTFRSGEQRNLLISDNQTRGFVTMHPARRKLLEAWTWGDGRPRQDETAKTRVESDIPVQNGVPYPSGPELFV